MIRVFGHQWSQLGEDKRESDRAAKRLRIRGKQARPDVKRLEPEPWDDAVQSRPTKRPRVKITGQYGEEGEGTTQPVQTLGRKSERSTSMHLRSDHA